MIKKVDLEELDQNDVVEIGHLIIESGPFRRGKIRGELSHSGYVFKEYKMWYKSEFKVMGSYPVWRIINLLNWIDGKTDIIRSGPIVDQPITRTIIEPRF